LLPFGKITIGGDSTSREQGKNEGDREKPSSLGVFLLRDCGKGKRGAVLAIGNRAWFRLKRGEVGCGRMRRW